MIRWLLWLLGGLLLGGIVHLATVLLLPRTATQDAYTRLSATAPANGIMALPAPTPDDALLPFMDPAFATAVCRYDLAAGPLKLRCVNRTLSSNERPLTRTSAAMEAPLSSAKNSRSSPEKVRGTRPGLGARTAMPNWHARR